MTAKYVVEGVAYSTHASATRAARELADKDARRVCVELGDSTQGTASREWFGPEHEPVAANEHLEPVDRSERLQKRMTAQPGTQPVPSSTD